MPERIRLIDAQSSWPLGGPPWTIVEVCFGHSTNWDLRLELERDEETAQIVFPHPMSFRVLDERELLNYWAARDGQAVQIGTLYLLLDSSVVQHFTLNASERLQHFLVAGSDTCVEVIGTHSPIRVFAG